MAAQIPHYRMFLQLPHFQLASYATYPVDGLTSINYQIPNQIIYTFESTASLRAFAERINQWEGKSLLPSLTRMETSGPLYPFKETENASPATRKITIYQLNLEFAPLEIPQFGVFAPERISSLFHHTVNQLYLYFKIEKPVLEAQSLPSENPVLKKQFLENSLAPLFPGAPLNRVSTTPVSTNPLWLR